MKDSTYIAVAIIISSIIGFSIYFNNTDNNDDPRKDLPEEIIKDSIRTASISSTIENVNVEDFFHLGEESAPVTMVFYADYHCGFCHEFKEEVFPQIKEKYIDTGKLLYIPKDFTTAGGDKAALAVRCAEEQGEFWSYNNLLYKNWNEIGNWNNIQTFVRYAREIQLNEEKFEDCFQEEKYKDKIDSSSKEAVDQGAPGVPYFIINSQSRVGAGSFSDFEKIIEEEIEKALQ